VVWETVATWARRGRVSSDSAPSGSGWQRGKRHDRRFAARGHDEAASRRVRAPLQGKRRI